MTLGYELPRRDTVLALEYEDNTVAVSLPPGWVALDTQSETLLDDIADATTIELDRWIAIAQVGVPDADDVALGVSTTQSETLEMIRRLTDDVPATTVALGVDIVGEDAEVLISAMTFSVVREYHLPAELAGGATVETTRGVTGMRFSPDDGLPDFRRAGWVLSLPGNDSTLVIGAEALGPGAEVMPGVWDWVIDELDPTGLAAEVMEVPSGPDTEEELHHGD